MDFPDPRESESSSVMIESEPQKKYKPITCRLCLTTISNQFLNMFETIDDEETIANIVAKHFSFIQPVSEDQYSENICQICWQIVRDFHEYYTTVHNAQSNVYNTETIFFTTTIKIEKSENSDVSDNSCPIAGIHAESDVFINEEINSPSNSGTQSENQNKPKILETAKKEGKIQSTKRKTSLSKHASKCKNKESDLKFAKPSRVDTLKPLLMPKTFDQQILTDNIFKRFEKIRPFLVDDTNNMFNCNYCNKTFNIRSTASSHMYRNHPLPFVCPDGDARYETLQEALDHIKNAHTSDHHDSTVCSVCGKILSTVGSLKSHMESVHRPLDQPKVQCKECGAWLADQKILAIHRSRQHINKKKPMKCDQCSRTLSSAKRLAYHKRRYHEHNLTMHKCTICDKEFHFKPRLREHISSVHAGEALYKCNFCPKTFNVRSNYYTHRRRMHPDEHQQILDKREADRVIMNNDNDVTTIKYKCHICDIEYQFKQKLKEHIAAEHEGAEASFQCEFCAESFHIRENYYTHRRQQHPAEYKKILDKKVSKKKVRSTTN